MKLYYIRDKAVYSRSFPISNTIGPMAEPIPFLSGKHLEHMKSVWRVNSSNNRPGIYVDTAGSKWPDMMCCASGIVPFFCSERIVHGLRGLNCTIRYATQLPVVKIGSKKLSLVPPPHYYIIQVAAGIDADLEAMGVELDELGNPVFDSINPEPPIANMSTWNGEDVFSWRNIGAGPTLGLTLICTEKVAELSEKEKWTNVRFDPIDTI